MTCVYDCLIRELKLKMSPEQLLKRLKKNNRVTRNVLWNNEELTEQQLKENYDRIQSIDDSLIDGYDCSTCDPVLVLVSELHNKSITHEFNGIVVKYKNKAANSKRRLIITSNDNHMF